MTAIAQQHNTAQSVLSLSICTTFSSPVDITCTNTMKLSIAPLIFLLSIVDAATATEHGALRHLKGKLDGKGKPDQPGPQGEHPNKDDHTPNNGCPKQTFPATGTECPNGGAFGKDTCIACCECECDDETGVVEAKAKCEFEGEEDTAPEDLSTCATHDMFDYDGVDGNCDSTCAAACTAPERK